MEVVGVLFRGVIAVRTIARAVAALIQGEDVEARGEMIRRLLPHATIARGGMEEDQRRLRPRPFVVMHLQAIRQDHVLLFHGFPPFHRATARRHYRSSRYRIFAITGSSWSAHEEGEMATVTVHGDAAGFKQEITAGIHRLGADEPIADGGTDTGPSPYDLLLAALGA